MAPNHGDPAVTGFQIVNVLGAFVAYSSVLKHSNCPLV